jgi:tetratricopeptide (TPR) repeat protein
MRKHCFAVALVCLSLAVSLPAFGQSAMLNLPRDSQAAAITQRVGITDITIRYHRPLVKGRQIFGNIVPYGQVWRAGANENTTIQFTDAVTIEGKPLDKGTYGLHMIPGENEWTVIFSKANQSWGSFTYKESEDALRVTVKPQTAEMREALSYDFNALSTNDSVATMRWDKVAVPFKISVNVDEVVAASLQKQLRGMAQYTWDGWDDAGNYLLTQKFDLDDALKYEDQSIQQEDRFENEMTKSKVMDALGRTTDAKATREKAMAIASPIQKHSYGIQLLGQQKRDEAFEIFKANYKAHPEMWFAHTGMARVYSAQGNFDQAVKEMKTAYQSAPDVNKPVIEAYIKRLENKDDITR